MDFGKPHFVASAVVWRKTSTPKIYERVLSQFWPLLHTVIPLCPQDRRSFVAENGKIMKVFIFNLYIHFSYTRISKVKSASENNWDTRYDYSSLTVVPRELTL